ncbi:hypothetical protein WR25_14352 [Diploscapter pachys]|uniref:F-box domain-containing protein n=1 Tax=Diploscapter pachys TaxID=2018661 RepID=A0A2A2J360_9BILA|nr:hypothetical protein WR25_14352 [Diploscapter pachys]
MFVFLLASRFVPILQPFEIATFQIVQSPVGIVPQTVISGKNDRYKARINEEEIVHEKVQKIPSLFTKMLANLPVEMILLICEYPEFKDLGQLAWTNKRMMQIFKKYRPMALERKTLFYRPDPPEWRQQASVTYFKNKFYYLGGWEPEEMKTTNRVDLLMDGIRRYIDYQTMNGNGSSGDDEVFKFCLCFDPIGSRISRIADMKYARYRHSLVVTNGKLYAIGGFKKGLWEKFCNSIEEYDPQTNKWREVENIDIK